MKIFRDFVMHSKGSFGQSTVHDKNGSGMARPGEGEDLRCSDIMPGGSKIAARVLMPLLLVIGGGALLIVFLLRYPEIVTETADISGVVAADYLVWTSVELSGNQMNKIGVGERVQIHLDQYEGRGREIAGRLLIIIRPASEGGRWRIGVQLAEPEDLGAFLQDGQLKRGLKAVISFVVADVPMIRKIFHKPAWQAVKED
jgi:hypothetical protein